MMETLWRDVRYAFRTLAKNPGTTAIMVLILAIGIGATTAFFSVVYAVVLRPLPYKDSDRIVTFSERTLRGKRFTSHDNVLLWREQHRVFDAVADYMDTRFYVTGDGGSYQVKVSQISADFFSVLGVSPLLGRGFLPAEEHAGNNLVAVLSHRFWREHFGAAPDILGKTLSLAGTAENAMGQMQTYHTSYTVVGVMPPGFDFPFVNPVPFWIPRVAEPGPVNALARLRPDVTLKQAQAAIAVFAKRLEQSDSKANADLMIDVDRLIDRILGANRRMLLLILGAAGAVLLVACTNVASLFLVRASVRQNEIVMRVALGASRWSVVRLMLSEGLLVGGGGCSLGLILAYWLAKTLVGMCPVHIPRLQDTSISLPVLSVALGLSIVTGLSCAVMPAWRASGVQMGEMLKGGGRSLIGRGWQRLRAGLVICEISLSLVLLMGAGLMVRSVIGLQGIGLGFSPENIAVMQIDLPMAMYATPARCKAFTDLLVQRIEGLPHVRSVATMAHRLDLSSGPMGMNVSVRGRASGASDREYWVRMAGVSPGFFTTLGIPLLRGRTFGEQDPHSSIIIDQVLARRCFGAADPVGQILYEGNAKMNIVGVVGATREFENPDVEGSVYMRSDNGTYAAAVVVRADGNPENLAGAMRAEVLSLTKDQVVTRLEPLEVTLARMLGPRHFTMVLLILFAGIALILVAIGVYGLLQYSTMQQVRDIGIRMALGARKADVLRAVLSQGLRLTLIGVVVGVVGALTLTRVLASLLYGVAPTDILTLLCVAAALTSIALLASYVPARRAAAIDPMAALRHE